MPGLKHETVPVSCTAIPRSLLKENRFFFRDNIKDADGVWQGSVLIVLPGDPHMRLI